MITVFVVEDEPPILRAIKQMIEQTNRNYKIIGEALNGEDALPAIKILKPDVVFTDINMPALDGLTLIERLEDMDPKPIPIILSGYKEFEYAKKAIKLGVYDYLIKPLDLETLENLLNDIFDRIQIKRKNSQIELLEKTISNMSSSSCGNNISNSNLFDIKQYICILICAGSYCSSHSSTITPGNEFWMRNEPDDFLKTQVSPEFYCWVLKGERGNEKIILIASDFEKDNNELYAACKQIHSHFCSSEIPVTSVIGKVCQDIGSLGTQVRKMYSILKKNIIFGNHRLILESTYAPPVSKDDEKVLNASWEDFFVRLIQNNQSNVFKQNLNSMLILCENSGCRQFLLERILIHVFGLFSRAVESLYEHTVIDIDLEISELITGSTNYKLLYDGLCSITDEIFSFLKPVKTDMDSDKILMDAIEQYIKSNFSKPINLQTLSDKFGFVPQYLGRKYKKAKGISPNDYIIQLRINKAKELLLVDPPVVLKDISEAVGFSDQFYMSRVFKSVTGKSPSEFRLEK